ncbi:MAG: hypothetical protein IT168_31635 [Bryobacterales bacterium]|nr:hypothetical protein [Bryobacterales bacterium]
MTTPELAKQANCSHAAQSLAEKEIPPGKFVDKLEDEGLLHDAILFVAQMMSPSDAIKWACATVHALQPEGKPVDGQASLTAAEAWIKAPVDPTRWAAKDAADASGMTHATDCIAMAVFLSGGSITPPESPEVSPPPHAAQSLCSGAILLTAVANEPHNATERQRAALNLGRKQANLPPNPTPPPPPPAPPALEPPESEDVA